MEKQRLMQLSTRLMGVAFAIALAFIAGFAGIAQAEEDDTLDVQSVMYLPDVTSEMTDASYWSSKQPDPDALLADRATIDELNQAGIDGNGTHLQPLKEASGTYYDAAKQAALKNSAASEFQSMLDGLAGEPVYREGWTLIDQAYTDAILANYPTDGTEPDIASPYAIVTTHTTMRAHPTDDPLLYTEGDYDDDNLFLSALRVNEPVIIRAQSVDKKFFLCISSCINAAWVPAADVAICANHDEWLEAWDIPAGQELVVTGYKVRTEQSRETPNTADRMLYMGTTLERVDLDSPEQALEIVGTRSAYNNHVCYLPVRKSDGTYAKELALIAESAQVSEGFLPLTASNIATVALRSLGQMYGWGGMLEANDCSGYMRDVYKCFGLELARNTNWQMALPVRKYNLSGLDAEHKAAAIAQMPLGTVLFWGGHEMMYLGQEGGKLYVISATGGIGDLYGDSRNSYQVKGVIINTLDMLRGNRNTWLQTLTCANIPYIPESPAGADMFDMAFYENGITWPEDTYSYTGEAIAPDVGIPGLEKDTDYTVTFEDNTEVGTATVTVTGAGDYTGEVSRTFEIVQPQDTTTSIANATITVQDQVYTGEAIEPQPQVHSGKTLLEAGTDYTVSYEDNTKVGTATVVVTGAGSYSGEATATFQIVSSSLAKATVSVEDATYTGKKLTPKPEVKAGSIVLKEGQDYTVSYEDNKKPGKAIVVVTGKGNFTDSNFATFRIFKATQTIKAKNVAKTFKASAKTKKLAKDKVINLKKTAKVSAKTTLKYKKADKAGGKKIVIDKTTGKITLRKGLKKGTYNVKVKITAPADACYRGADSKTITVKVVVKA